MNIGDIMDNINNNLEKFQRFFDVDLRIKNTLHRDAPPFNDGRMDDYDIQEYIHKLGITIDDMFADLRKVAAETFGEKSVIYSKTVALEKQVKGEFSIAKVGNDLNRIGAFYNNYLSGMRLPFITAVQGSLVGYTFFGQGLVEQAVTVNELMHFMHSYIVNNENLLESIPAIGEKSNAYNYPITLRGVDSPVFRNLLDQLPNELDIGWTDMVAVSDRKMLMMVRDRGHALTIEITLNAKGARMEYFIPKICNVRMVNELPGLFNPVDKNSVGATGAIETSLEELPNTLYDFISRVPMDHDMEDEQKMSVA